MGEGFAAEQSFSAWLLRGGVFAQPSPELTLRSAGGRGKGGLSKDPA